MSKPEWKVVDPSTTSPEVTIVSPAPLRPDATPWAQKLWEILTARGRVRRSELLAAAMPLVPAGIAFRKNESQRNRGPRKGDGPAPAQRVHKKDMAFLVESGRRTIVMDTLWTMKHGGRILVEETDDGEVWVRLNPDYVEYTKRPGYHKAKSDAAYRAARTRKLLAVSADA